MNRNHIGMLAESRAGHDKGQIYVIIKEDEEYVYLSDGRLRPLDKLKKKNRKHIQLIYKPIQEIIENLQTDKELRNEEIKRAIRLFQKERLEEQSGIGGKRNVKS